MEASLRYRGRTVNADEMAFIRELIARHPGASRRKLSALLCEAWDWRQANGALRDMVCRGLMLELHRAGHIELPAKRFTPRNPLAVRSRPATDIEMDTRAMECAFAALGGVEIRSVRRTQWEGLFNGLIEAHHYLGYTQPVGEHLKQLVFAGERVVGALAWSSAPRHIGVRDRFIGWDQATRKRNLHLMAYNTRFLIPPWVRVPHLASHILGKAAREIADQWEALYSHRVWYLETFVDRERFRGTCYRAANWQYLGQTTGRGKDCPNMLPNRSRKDVLGYALSRDFRRRLCEGEDG